MALYSPHLDFNIKMRITTTSESDMCANIIHITTMKYEQYHIQGVPDQIFQFQMLISWSTFELNEKFKVLRRFDNRTIFSSQ